MSMWSLMAAPLIFSGDNARLRVVCEQSLAGVQLAALVNGHWLRSSGDLAPPFGYAYDRLLGGGRRRAWVCPSGLLHNGWNTVRIAVEKAGGKMMPEWLDLAIPCAEGQKSS